MKCGGVTLHGVQANVLAEPALSLKRDHDLLAMQRTGDNATWSIGVYSEYRSGLSEAILISLQCNSGWRK